MIGAVGDLVEDIVVNLDSAINHASDTRARIERRRGGSAATVAAVAARLSGSARFIGQVGADDTGTRVLAALARDSVDHVGPVLGTTGTIVVLVDTDSERTMLTDPGHSAKLSRPQQAWLDGLDALHIPFYSLAKQPIGSACLQLAAWSKTRGQTVSIDASSVSVLNDFGVGQAVKLLRQISPDVVFLNRDETALFRDHFGTGSLTPESLGAELLVCKDGPNPVVLLIAGREASRVPVPNAQSDSGLIHGGTTGAGDSFAAGFLTEFALSADPVLSAEAGHRAAARYLS